MVAAITNEEDGIDKTDQQTQYHTGGSPDFHFLYRGERPTVAIISVSARRARFLTS